MDQRPHQQFNPLSRVQNLGLQGKIIHEDHPRPTTGTKKKKSSKNKGCTVL
jgi:hypothetical protein